MTEAFARNDPRYDADANFWRRVERMSDAECWEWLGAVRRSGHGITTHKGKFMHASRRAWILLRGAIPEGLCVNHTCDNPKCCNPSHMYLGTRSDNMADRWSGQSPANCNR